MNAAFYFLSFFCCCFFLSLWKCMPSFGIEVSITAALLIEIQHSLTKHSVWASTFTSKEQHGVRMDTEMPSEASSSTFIQNVPVVACAQTPGLCGLQKWIPLSTKRHNIYIPHSARGWSDTFCHLNSKYLPTGLNLKKHKKLYSLFPLGEANKTRASPAEAEGKWHRPQLESHRCYVCSAYVFPPH